MLARYDSECTDIDTYMATEDDLVYFEKLRKKNKNNYIKGVVDE